MVSAVGYKRQDGCIFLNSILLCLLHFLDWWLPRPLSVAAGPELQDEGRGECLARDVVTIAAVVGVT